MLTFQTVFLVTQVHTWQWFPIDHLQQFCFRENMVGNVSCWKGCCHILISLPFSPLMVVLLDGKYRRPPFISKGIEFLFSSISLAVSRALTLAFFLVLLFSTATLFHSLITGQLRAFSSLLPLRPRRLRGPQEWEWKRYHFMWRSGESLFQRRDWGGILKERKPPHTSPKRRLLGQGPKDYGNIHDQIKREDLWMDVSKSSSLR